MSDSTVCVIDPVYDARLIFLAHFLNSSLSLHATLALGLTDGLRCPSLPTSLVRSIPRRLLPTLSCKGLLEPFPKLVRRVGDRSD